MSLSFADVVDDSMLAYVETQMAFSDWITQQTGGGSDEQKVDRPRRQVTWVPKLHKRDEVVATAHWVARVHGEDVRWAWADPDAAGTPFVRLAERLRAFGEQNQIPELAAETTRAQAFVVAGVATRITEIPATHMAPSPDGGVDVFVVDPAGFTLPPLGPDALVRIATSTFAADGVVHDQRRAIQGWALARRMPHRWADPGTFRTFDIGFPAGPTLFHFDDAGRLENATPPGA